MPLAIPMEFHTLQMDAIKLCFTCRYGVKLECKKHEILSVHEYLACFRCYAINSSYTNLCIYWLYINMKDMHKQEGPMIFKILRNFSPIFTMFKLYNKTNKHLCYNFCVWLFVRFVCPCLCIFLKNYTSVLYMSLWKSLSL